MRPVSGGLRLSSPLAPLYAGGFLGPFGGGMLAPLIPSVASGLGASIGLVAGAITAFMVPFAGLQLVSGTIAERRGGVRVVRIAYLAFGAAALLSALAPEIWTFIAARALMGAANAFLTPILLAGLSEAVPPAVLGRAVGTFAAVQVSGLTLAPVLGGALGEASWRLGFALTALVSVVLAAAPLPKQQAADVSRQPARLRTLLNRRLGLLALAATAGYLGFTGIGFVLALVVSDEYGLGSGASGLVVSAYGVGGIVLGRFGGALADRIGRPRTALLGGGLCALGVLVLAFAPEAWGLALVWFCVGLASALAWAGLNTIALESSGENRAGSISVYSAFKFVGVAVAPLLYVPLFHADSRLPFLVAAGFAALFAALVLPWFSYYRRAQAEQT